MAAKDDIRTDFTEASESRLNWLMPPSDTFSEIVIACTEEDYSASAIARAVEDCDAHLLNLNVTAARTPTGELLVELRFNHRNPSAVVRSLERYGFRIIDSISANANLSEQDRDDTLRRRANELLHYLEI